MRRTLALAVLLLLASTALHAQDIRGLEACMAEKQMERRTGCLQANAEFLQQEIVKLRREADAKQTAASREFTAAKAEIATLRTALSKLEGELAQLRAKVDAKK
jgi:predicted RNase H-like nuclease (RuvC/YqgF family)